MVKRTITFLKIWKYKDDAKVETVQKLMKIQDLLNEIDYADNVGKNTILDFELIENSMVVGDFDFHVVHLYQDKRQEVFFFQENDKLTAFIILDGGNLRGIKNVSGVGGQVTALVTFVAHLLKRKIVIPSTEQLTKDGLDWLTSLIAANGRGLTLSDQTGNYPNADMISREWEKAKVTRHAGPTAVIIESHMTRYFKTIKEDYRLMNPYWVIGSETLS